MLNICIEYNYQNIAIRCNNGHLVKNDNTVSDQYLAFGVVCVHQLVFTRTGCTFLIVHHGTLVFTITDIRQNIKQISYSRLV